MYNTINFCSNFSSRCEQIQKFIYLLIHRCQPVVRSSRCSDLIDNTDNNIQCECERQQHHFIHLILSVCYNFENSMSSFVPKIRPTIFFFCFFNFQSTFTYEVPKHIVHVHAIWADGTRNSQNPFHTICVVFFFSVFLFFLCIDLPMCVSFKMYTNVWEHWDKVNAVFISPSLVRSHSFE